MRSSTTVAAVLVRRNREDARLARLCERHHTKIHSGFRVERQPDGRWRTWRPDGTEITTPAPLLSPAA